MGAYLLGLDVDSEEENEQADQSAEMSLLDKQRAEITRGKTLLGFGNDSSNSCVSEKVKKNYSFSYTSSPIF